MLFSARTNDVIELNVINGTLNLNLGGNVDAFEAVIGEPPATSSELTLIQALGKINQVLQKNTIYKTHHWLWLSLLLPYVLLFNTNVLGSSSIWTCRI